jgi:hypothetical protein
MEKTETTPTQHRMSVVINTNMGIRTLRGLLWLWGINMMVTGVQLFFTHPLILPKSNTSASSPNNQPFGHMFSSVEVIVIETCPGKL